MVVVIIVVDSGSGDDVSDKDNDAIISQRRLDFACDVLQYHGKGAILHQ